VKRLLLIAVVLAALVPADARGGACSPLNCSPSQFTLAHGTLLGVRAGVDRPVRVIDLRTGATRWRLPAGIVTGGTLVHQDGSLLTWYSLTTGARLRDALVQQHGTSYKDIHEHSGVSPGTLTAWFAGATRKPQAATINAVVRSMGWKLGFMPYDAKPLVQPTPAPPKAQSASLRHVVAMAQYRKGARR